ncbi:hypothetical protein HK104_005639, partial [Borealophlyctis nickersoniae]
MRAFVPILAAASFAAHVSAHGFLCSPIEVDSNTPCTVRDIQKINNGIDNLRNPTTAGTCRGVTTPGKVTPVTLTNGESHTITIALSDGAQHIGPCWVEILDKNLGNAVRITDDAECARPPQAQRDTVKTAPASDQCPGYIPFGLVTNDMCLNTWTFTVKNVEQITCTDCVM